MATIKKSLSFEKALLSHLKESKIDKRTLSEFSKAVLLLRGIGVQDIDILINGQPAPDWLRVTGTLPGAKLSKLTEIFKIPRIKGLEIFPKGIIDPNLFLQVNVGNYKQPG